MARATAQVTGNVEILPEHIFASGPERRMDPVTAASAAEVVRLTEVVDRQRRELDRLRAAAAQRSVLDMARGMLMERLRCSAVEAAGQLARLAEEAGTTVLELAAEVTGKQAQLLAGEQTRLLAGPQGTGGPGETTQPREASQPGEAAAGERAAQRALGYAVARAQQAPEGDAVAGAVLEEALAPAGAVAVALWVLGPDGRLDLAGQAGLGTREAGRWQSLPPAMDCLPQRAARTGNELLWPGGRPGGDSVPLMADWFTGARAVLPMRADGPVMGVLLAIWQDKLAAFDSGLRKQLAAVADVCARALSAQEAVPGWHQPAWLFGLLDSVIESALFAYPLQHGDGSVGDFHIGHVTSEFRDPAGRGRQDLAGRTLLELYPMAALPGGLFDRAVEVLSSGAPHHMAGGILPALESQGGGAPVMDIRIARLLGGVVISLRRVDEAERLASLLGHAERLGRIGGWEENLLTGEIHWTESACLLFARQPGEPIPLADLYRHALPDDQFSIAQFRDRLLGEKRATATAFRVIRPDDESVRQMRAFAEPVIVPGGVVAAVRGAFQDVSAYYHTQVALTATRDQLADTEERAAEEHWLAVRLQQAITPWSSEPVRAAGVEAIARYRPSGEAGLVSGDWYDTVVLPDGQVLLVVGDIAGHGIDAVTGMVEMRNCLRGLAITGAGPAELLGWLNEFACNLTGGTIGTVVCGKYDPAGRALRWARAGHIPPVVVRDGAARMLPAIQGLLLGADPDIPYQEESTHLRPGDLLLLFTDGMVERRDTGIDDAIDALLRCASRPVDDISEYADHLLGHTESNTGDDACLVAVRIR
jgi:PAS domain-containing protein